MPSIRAYAGAATQPAFAPTPSTGTNYRLDVTTRSSQAIAGKAPLTERLTRLERLVAASHTKAEPALSASASQAVRQIISAASRPDRIKIYPLGEGGIRLMVRDGVRSVSLSVDAAAAIKCETFDGVTGAYARVTVNNKGIAAHYLDLV